MFEDLLHIDNIKNLDKNLYDIILLKSDNIKLFINIYKYWINMDDTKHKNNIKKYIITYGFMLFSKLSYITLHTLDKGLIDNVLDILDFVYSNGSDRIKTNIFKIIENGFLKVSEETWNWYVIKEFIKYKPFQDFLLNTNISNPLEFEKTKFLGKILSMDLTNGEKSKNVINTRYFQKELNQHIFDIFTSIYKANGLQLLTILDSVVKFNAPKANITNEIYYSDFLNTYHFIETCLSILLHINKEFSDINDEIDNTYIYSELCPFYKNNSLSLTGENIISNNNFNNKTKLNFLIFSYYRILYYSLITQNYNCYLQNILSRNNYSHTLVKKYIELNNIYIYNPYNLLEISTFLHHFIDNIDFNYVTEDIIYDVLQFYLYMIEYSITQCNKDLLPVFFFKKIIMENNIVKNPYLRLRSSKLIYLYEINFGKLDLGDNFLNALIELSIQIHNLVGMDLYSERIFHQSIILKILTGKSYITKNKDLYIVLFTEYNSLINNKIIELKNLILNSNNLTFEILTAYYKNLEIYLTHMQNYLCYIEFSFSNADGPFNVENQDITYHFCKFIYCIFKNMFDNNSSVIKINYNESNFWLLFKKYVLELFVTKFEKIFEITNIVKTLYTFYPDIDKYINLFDIEFETEYSQRYRLIAKGFKNDVLPDNLPNEYLDPILFTPIIQPMILPDSGIIIDRTVIMSHLLENKYDPFNRQPITFEELEEYNAQDSLKQKCADFLLKRDNWIKENHQNE